MGLCLKCGSWKQAPTQRCACGFEPARGSLDEAKSFVLLPQFRPIEELEANARAIGAGEAVEFREEELRRARGIGRWNAAVTFAFLAFAVLAGLTLGGAVAGLPLWGLAALAVLAGGAFAG